MKKYELTILWHTDLEGMKNTEEHLKDRVEQLVERYGFEVVSHDYDGKKRLAYPLGDEDCALFDYYVVEGDGEIGEVARDLDTPQEILRYLLCLVSVKEK